MIIRYLTQNDITEHDKISSQAFVYACDIGDPDSVLPCEKVLGAFDDDNKSLFADLEIHERICRYDGGTLSCAAVGGVAAKPEHRGKGAVQALFRHLFRETDYDVSILYPFSEAYYRRLGYERVGHSLSAAVPFSAVSGIRRNQDVTLYEGGDPQRLLTLYNRCAERFNLSFVREDTAAFSGDPYLSQKYTYIWKNNSFATISVDREKSTVFVHEIWFDSCASMLGIIGFLRNFESNQKTICFEKLPEDTPLLSFLQDLKPCDIRLYNTGSARILNIEKILRSHRYPADGAFTLRIGDDVFRVTVSDGVAEVRKNSGHRPDVTMDVHTASKLLLRGFADGSYIPDIVMHDPQSDFFTMFPPKTTFFSDGF